MSDYNLKQKQAIKEQQLKFLVERYQSLSPLERDHQPLAASRLKDILATYESGIRPLFVPIPAIRHQLPWKEDVSLNHQEVSADLGILNNEQGKLGDYLKDSFNLVHSEQKRLQNRLAKLHNLTGDLNLIAKETGDHVIYFKESFQDITSGDSSFQFDGVHQAAIWPNEGILTLATQSSVNLSSEARLLQAKGNGEFGGRQLARKFIQRDTKNDEVEAFQLLHQLDANYHADTDNLLDNRPDTVLEYQLVNVPENFKQTRGYYDFDWATGDKTGSRLRLKLTFDLGKVGPLNWIGLAPYFPYGSTGRFSVHSIQTSGNGFEYEPIYLSRHVLDQTVSDVGSSLQLDELFTGNTDPSLASHSGQGVWVFPEKQARYVELVLDQDYSYPEVIGQEICTIGELGSPHEVVIPMPEELKNSLPGEYIRTVDGQRVVYRKKLDVTSEGWRYAIGLRDVYFMRYAYEEKSQVVFKEYEIDGDIQRLMLYANEIIPESYQQRVAELNDWVVYEVSFDDINWIRISPMHHEPVNNAFPPKILELNDTSVADSMAFQIHKAYVRTNQKTNRVRLKITLNRPEGDEFLHTTPIIQDVALKLEKRSDTLS